MTTAPPLMGRFIAYTLMGAWARLIRTVMRRIYGARVWMAAIIAIWGYITVLFITLHILPMTPIRFAVSCSLIKCVYLYNKTLKKLCDWYSSAYGSVYCSWNIRCPGALSDLSTSGDCNIHGHWSQTASGGSYYDLGLGEGRAQLYLKKPGYAFSARCVRYLMNLCLLIQ